MCWWCLSLCAWWPWQHSHSHMILNEKKKKRHFKRLSWSTQRVGRFSSKEEIILQFCAEFDCSIWCNLMVILWLIRLMMKTNQISFSFIFWKSETDIKSVATWHDILSFRRPVVLHSHVTWTSPMFSEAFWIRRWAIFVCSVVRY